MEFFTPGHLIVIAIVALVLFFGWKQLPDMARSVGRSLRVFKTEVKGMSADDKARQDAEASGERKQLDASDDRGADVRGTGDRGADQPAVLPQADVVRRPAAEAREPQAARPQAAPPHTAPQSAPAVPRSRPRPTPSPNGRTHAGR